MHKELPFGKEFIPVKVIWTLEKTKTAYKIKAIEYNAENEIRRNGIAISLYETLGDMPAVITKPRSQLATELKSAKQSIRRHMALRKDRKPGL